MSEHTTKNRGTWVQRAWWTVRDDYHELKPCRFSFFVALLACPVFLYIEQGIEILRTVGEGSAAGGRWEGFRLFGFFFALALWAITSWYAARVLLYLKFRDAPEGTSSSWLRTNVPRILGIAPMIIIAGGFLRASGPYDLHSSEHGWLICFGVLCLVLAAIFYFVLILRRKFIGAPPAREIKRLSQLGWDSWIGLGLMATASLFLFVLFAAKPVTAQSFGMGTILFLAAASWVTLGSFLVYLGGIWRFPVIGVLVLLALIFSFWNDNHIIRLAPPQKTDRPDVLTAFATWYGLMEKEKAGEMHTLYIVATEGGGIRAAYWTAAVLGDIQDQNPSFAAHLFAISGVSGGSLGGSVFEALLAEKSVGSFKDAGTDMLAQDFLSPALAGMLYPDLVQRLLPWPFPSLDRGRALELGWEKAWRDKMRNDRFERSFVDLWSDGPDRRSWMPALFLNGTSVEKGNRVITTNLRLTNHFIDAADAARKLSASGSAGDLGCHIPLSTAAHMSARFTYVSPAGRFPDGTHIVDGGYFENSAATTAYEIAKRIKDRCAYPQAPINNVDVKVIMISNDPRKRSLDPAAPAPKSSLLKRTPKMTSHGNFLGDVTAPIYALMNTRDARGRYAQKNIALEERRRKANMSVPAPPTPDIIYFKLRDTQVPLPLGWMLSAGAAKSMQQQLELDDDVVQNKSALQQVLASLPH
jgi:hypothetical protein